MNSSAVEKSRIEEQPDSMQKDTSMLEDKSEKLLSLFRHVNLAALKSLNEYLSDICDKITQTWTQSTADAKSADKSAENSDDIDDMSPEDFVQGIISDLASVGDVGELFRHVLNTLRISNDLSNLAVDTPAIKNIMETVQKVKVLKQQRRKLDELTSVIATSISAISSTPERSFVDTESTEYLEIFNSAVGDFQSIVFQLGAARDTVQSTIDSLEKSLIEKFASFITSMANSEQASNGSSVPGDQGHVESFSDTVAALRNALKAIPAKVERWESQAKAKVDIYSKEQAQLTNSATIAKYSGVILEHKQTIEQMLNAAHQEIDGILEAGLNYSNQACALYLEQLKLTATIKALPCNDTSKHILGSLMAHKRCKKCKTLDWTMCRIEDGFLCCTSCAQSETGKWVRVVVS